MSGIMLRVGNSGSGNMAWHQWTSCIVPLKDSIDLAKPYSSRPICALALASLKKNLESQVQPFISMFIRFERFMEFTRIRPPSFLPEWIPKSYLTSEWYPAWYRRLNLWVADYAFIDPVMKREIVGLRKSLDLPRWNTFARNWWNSPDQILALYPHWWAGEHPDWPDQVVTTGFPFWDRGTTQSIDPELKQFLENSGKVIVCTPGASSGHNESQFRTFENSCKQLGQKGLIITSAAPPFQSETVRFTSYIPFQQLLPYASAVVHHAGIGTSAYCLAAGVPQVVIPTLYNQPDTAIRLEKLGVARQIAPNAVTEKRLTKSLKDLLESDLVARNCEQLAKMIGESDPMPTICAKLESLSPNSTR